MNKIKFVILFFLLVFCFLVTAIPINAKEGNLPKISVVYPRQGGAVTSSDSTFIFGSVTPESRLSINGQTVKVSS